MRRAFLYLFKPVNKFEEEYKPGYAGEVKNCCKHNFIFKIWSWPFYVSFSRFHVCGKQLQSIKAGRT